MKKFVGNMFNAKKDEAAKERENEVFKEARSKQFEQLFGPVPSALDSSDAHYRYNVSMSGLRNSYLKTGNLDDLKITLEQYKSDKFIIIKSEVLEALQAKIDFAISVTQNKSFAEYLVQHAPAASQTGNAVTGILNTPVECKRLLSDLSNYPSIDKAIQVLNSKINKMDEGEKTGFNLSKEYLQSVSVYLINNKDSLNGVKEYYDSQKQERSNRPVVK